MNIKLNLKVLNEIKEDLNRVEAQLVRFRDPAVQEKYRAEVKKMQEAANRLFEHYKIILDSQK